MKVIRGDQTQFVPASHEDPRNPGVLKRVLATSADLAAGQLQMLNWSLLKVGRAFEQHSHEDMQEVFIIMDGQAVMTVDGESVVLHAGDAVIVSPTELHQMQNTGDEDVLFLVFGIATSKEGATARRA